jgi:tetratricopeptide (TPR) repeat protein
MAGLTWLHLSDWHQKGEDFDRRVVRDALIEDIKNRYSIHKDLEKVDFILFSGDLAFSGKKEEYQAAETHLIEPVLKATGLDKSHLFIVPGNHDLDRDEFKYLPEDLKKPLTEDNEIKKWLGDDKGRNRMLEPFGAYNEFVKEYADGNLSAYACGHSLTVDGKKVALMGFNSALMCGRHKDKKNEIDDKGKIIVGEPQVYDTLNKHRDADILIVVLHHPFDWLTDKDCINVERRLKEAAHFMLCGHQHRPKVTIETGTEGDCIIIPAGASYERRNTADSRYNNAYNFVHLDLANNKGAVYLRTWSESIKKWREDIDAAYPGGRFDLALPKELFREKKEESLSTPEPPKDPDIIKAPPSPASKTYNLENPVFNVPFRAKGDGMVGREEALQEVRQQLTEGKPMAIGHTAAFQGLGGLGKTQLAVEYAHRFRKEYPKGIIWINADQEIDPQLIQIGKQAKWVHQESKHSDILDIAKQRLKTRSDCLIIFDNVEEREAIEPYLPDVDAKPHLLLTSRAFQKGFVSIDISLLDEELSLKLLLKESNRDFNSLPETEQEAVREITRSLGGLPLAIEIAGAYLSYIKSCTFQKYHAFLKENLQEAMRGELLSSFTKHEENLFLTLQVSKQVLDQEPFLNDILDLLAWSGNSFMGISLMDAILNKKEPDLFQPLNIGVSLHLLQKAQGGERYDIHRLVRRVRQEQFPIANRVQWIKDTCQRLGDWFEERRKEFSDLPAFEAEMDHLKQWLSHVKPSSSIHTSRLTWLQAYPPYHWGKYNESHQLVQSAFSLLAETSEKDPKLQANILNDLGYTYSQLGEFQKSLEYHNQALKIRQETFGEQHPDTATSLNNVGGTYGNLGDHNKALEYQLRALKIQQQLFGEQHQDTAQSLNNVGLEYGEKGDHKKALKYNLRALEIRQQLFGEQHPDTANSLNNVGGTYAYLGDHEKALKYQLRALEIRQQLFGEQHPDTATSLNNVGGTYGDLGDHKKALKFKLRALEIRQKLFGEQHPDTANSLNNVGYTYANMGNRSEALKYFMRSFDIIRQLLGEQHHKTATTLVNLIYSLTKLKRFQQARDRLNDYLEQLPQDHPKYEKLSNLKNVIHKEERKSMGSVPSKKKKKKKKK